MIRRVTFAALALTATAHADSDQSVTAAVGFAGGGAWTPGGLHVDAAYLLRLDDSDWFDIGIAATKGGNTAACYADRSGGYTCNHGLAQGESVGFRAGLRHYLTDRYFLRAGVGVAVVRFPDDVVLTMTDATAMPAPTTGMNGIAITLHAGGGLRVPITAQTALVGAAELIAGASGFAGTADAQHQFGFAITIGAELRP
jgi:hypothetical protein